MSSAREVGGRPPEQWPNLSKEGVLDAPLVQAADMRWGPVRVEGTRMPHGQS